MTRRVIYECKSCNTHCTIRTYSHEKPTGCIFYKEYSNWIRKDKHEQKNMEEF